MPTDHSQVPFPVDFEVVRSSEGLIRIQISTEAPPKEVPINVFLELWDVKEQDPPRVGRDRLGSTPEDPPEWSLDEAVANAWLGDGAPGGWKLGSQRVWRAAFHERFLGAARITFVRPAPMNGTHWVVHLNALLRESFRWAPFEDVPNPSLDSTRVHWPGPRGRWVLSLE